MVMRWTRAPAGGGLAVPATGGAGERGGTDGPSGTVLSPTRKRLVLTVACMSTVLVNLDNTIVNVALPGIRAQLHPSLSGLQWIVDSYLMTLAALLILSGSLFTVIEVPRLGAGSGLIRGGIVVTVLSAAALVMVERRRTDPLIDFRFFRSVPFSLSMLIAVLTYSAMGGFLFLNTVYLQDVCGYAPFRAGLYTLPMALGTIVGAQLAAWLVRVRGAVVALVAAGASMTGAAVITGAVVGSDTSFFLLTGYTLLGLGFGGANTPVNNTAMAGMPRSRAGVAGALASSSRQLGQSLGVAVYGAISSAGSGRYSVAAYASVSLPGWCVIAGTGLVITVLGVVASSRGARRSAERVSVGFDES
ncbi:MFS transporter [Kitasatospora sp. GP82]|uniref:MFS transporter n=1 Tax=Kitasatospora sp. GP82 TaxID=3035089 RepID=UPI0024766121|nr:MFS transporter [Kitasatospora sp. GP82]MDH6126512.1 MFS family permease [Kitasatospora sp. GP82]